MLTYCNRCVMPSTKPDLFIDPEGVCSACRYYERRTEVDWGQRRQELLAIVERYRSRSGSNYDCIVPVSGGKDSTYQTLRMREMGMNPLCVTATTDKLSAIGRRQHTNIPGVIPQSGSARLPDRSLSLAVPPSAPSSFQHSPFLYPSSLPPFLLSRLSSKWLRNLYRIAIYFISPAGPMSRLR